MPGTRAFPAGSLSGGRKPTKWSWGEVTHTTAARRDDRPVVVIGAGPAGLTAAYQLTKASGR